MNNIYGQPINYYDRYEDSYTRPRQQSQSRRHENNENNEHCEHHEDHHEENKHCECHEDNKHCECHEDNKHCEHHEEHCERCEQLGGTVLRINIPAGAEINILNLVELASPSGICLILRLPFLGGECK